MNLAAAQCETFVFPCFNWQAGRDDQSSVNIWNKKAYSNNTFYKIKYLWYIMMFVFGSFYVNPNMRSEGNLPSAGQHSFLTTFTNILGGPEDKTVHAVVLHELVDWSQRANVLNHISHNGQRVQK